MAITVTLHESGTTFGGGLLRIKVLTGAAASQAGAATATFGGTGAQQASITTTVTGSQVYAALKTSSTTTLTANGNTTLFDNIVDNQNGEILGSGRSTSATGTPGAITIGASAPSVGGQTALLEILPSGTITEDASSPAPASNAPASWSDVVSPSFSPPPGSLLVAIVTADASGATVVTVSGGGLTWTEKIKSQAAGGATGYAGVWTAVMPPLTGGQEQPLSPVNPPGLISPASWADQPSPQPAPADPGWLGPVPPTPGLGQPYAAAAPPFAPPFTTPSSWSQPWPPPADPGRQPFVPPPFPYTANFVPGAARPAFATPADPNATFTTAEAGVQTGAYPSQLSLAPPFTTPSSWSQPWIPGTDPGLLPPPSGGTGPPVYPLGRPVQARRLPQRGGSAQSRAGVFAQAGPPVKPPEGPVKAQPAVPFLKGRTTARAGTFGGTGPPVKPQQGPVAAKGRGLPPRGRVSSRMGTFAQAGAPVTPPHGPVQAKQLPRRGGTVTARAGTFTSTAIVSGPPVYPLGHPVQARRLPQRGGSAQSRTGTWTFVATGSGPPVYPLGHPVQARRLPLQGGRVIRRAGTYAQAGPAVKPLQGPVSAARRPLPARGRVTALRGPYGQAGPPVIPLRRPVAIRRTLPPRGSTAWRSGVYTPPPLFVVARSTPTVTAPDTSAASVTDPRDGTNTVTAIATSSPGVT